MSKGMKVAFAVIGTITALALIVQVIATIAMLSLM